MDFQLDGKRAVVTGSSAGIGEAIARRLAAEGTAVTVHGRRADAVDAVVEAIRSAGGQASGVPADLADPQGCARFVSGVMASGGADILVNNAGAFVNRGWDDVTPQDWPAIEAGILAGILDNPTGRLGRPEEVADLVAFVTSPLAGYINGANLRIDGGSTAVV